MTIQLSFYARAAIIAFACATAATMQGQQTGSIKPVVACNPQDYTTMKSRLLDWAGLDRYKQDDAARPVPAQPGPRVIFLATPLQTRGDVTRTREVFFPGKDYINRGISGQTTPQMLVRFEQDVVHLHPAPVVILAGTNDVDGIWRDGSTRGEGDREGAAALILCC